MRTAKLTEADRSWVVFLPIPPSANGMYRAAGGRVLMSAGYRGWLEECYADCLRAGLAHRLLRGPLRVSVLIRGGQGFKTSCDLDNRAKPLVDGLRKAGVILNDTVRTITELNLRYVGGQGGQANRCEVTIEELSA